MEVLPPPSHRLSNRINLIITHTLINLLLAPGHQLQLRWMDGGAREKERNQFCVAIVRESVLQLFL